MTVVFGYAKRTVPSEPSFFEAFTISALRDRGNRALTCAGAAVDAGARIDDVLRIALADGGYGTCGYTCAAVDASFADYIRHDTIPSFPKKTVRQPGGSVKKITSTSIMRQTDGKIKSFAKFFCMPPKFDIPNPG